jgi:hypothetical protein
LMLLKTDDGWLPSLVCPLCEEASLAGSLNWYTVKI